MAIIWLAVATLSVLHILRWRAVPLPAWLPFILGILLVAASTNQAPAVRLLLSSLVLLYFVKASAVLALEPPARPAGIGALLYHTVWPGISALGLINREVPLPDSGRRFKRGYAKFLLGLTACALLAWNADRIPATLLGGAGIAALLLTVHLGFSDMLTSLFQCQGQNVSPLFDDPLKSRSLNEFWTRRWNLAFVQMNRILFMRPLVKRFGIRGAVIGSFIISGLLHELAISFPAGTGYGGPFAYFLIQIVLVTIERRLKLSGPLWTWISLLLPAPILFHHGFRTELVAPLFTWVGTFLHRLTYESFWNLAFIGLGLIHFLILAASAQVPTRLNWKEELPRISSLNRKLMWTYGAFIVLCIIAFGIMTLALRRELIAANPATLWLSGFIAVFWTLRVICDNFVLKFEDWPQGPEFEIGHVLLNTIFLTLSLGYGGFLVLSLVRG